MPERWTLANGHIRDLHLLQGPAGAPFAWNIGLMFQVASIESGIGHCKPAP
jgi:hypothetical protein